MKVDGIEIKVKRKNIKNLNLRIKAKDEVNLSVPKGVTDEYIKSFLNERIGWIKEKIDGLEPVESPPRYISGQVIKYFGRDYPLRIMENMKARKVHLNGNEIIVELKTKADEEKVKKEVEEFYRADLVLKVEDLVGKYEPIMGVKVEEIRTKKMKTRWGTCNTNKNRIWINLEFARFRPELLDYIVVHEMTHLLEKGHNKRFYAYMDRFLPNWADLKEELNKNSIVLID